jgi:hypothetical protein
MHTVYKYNAKNQLVLKERVIGHRYATFKDFRVVSPEKPDYRIVYTYNDRDSLEWMEHYSWKDNQWKLTGLTLLRYGRDKKLSESHVSKALNAADPYFADLIKPKALLLLTTPGKKSNITDKDLSGNASTYQYDAQGRLIKITRYYVFSDQIFEAWEWVYSGQHLQTDKHEKFSGKGEVYARKKNEYSYSADGKLIKLITTEKGERYTGAKLKPFEGVVARRFFEYENGRLVKERVERLESYKVARVSFADRMAAYQDNSYTVRYGDVSYRVISTSNDPSKLNAKQKTKYKWVKEEVDHSSDYTTENAVRKNTENVHYDSKGRVTMYRTSSIPFSSYEEVTGTETRYYYYRNK